MLAAAEAIVEALLLPPVAIGIEHASDVGETVPLRRILQIEHGQIVADDVGKAALNQFADEIGPSFAQCRAHHGRESAWVERVAAGQIPAMTTTSVSPIASTYASGIIRSNR